MNQKQILEVLKYIANSPPEKSGGFHENTINVAKDAIKLIADLKSDNSRLKGIIKMALEEIPDKPKLPIVIDIKDILNEAKGEG